MTNKKPLTLEEIKQEILFAYREEADFFAEDIGTDYHKLANEQKFNEVLESFYSRLPELLSSPKNNWLSYHNSRVAFGAVTGINEMIFFNVQSLMFYWLCEEHGENLKKRKLFLFAD